MEVLLSRYVHTIEEKTIETEKLTTEKTELERKIENCWCKGAPKGQYPKLNYIISFF